MMREQVAPALRQLGLKGSGQAFSLPSERHWALIGFQKSAISSSASVKFTVNLQVVSQEAWLEARKANPRMPNRPSANSLWPVEGWHDRIGLLLPKRGDRWWWIEPDRPTEPVAEDVVVAIRDYGLPEMKRRMA
jgi:hypothetical protein